jgi:GNAT superfamily N-acetyltransferase
MMAFSRVAYVCKCPTQVPAEVQPEATGALLVRTGGESDIDRLPEELLSCGRRERLQARLADGELFVVGDLEGRLVSSTWLRPGGVFSLHHLPGKTFRLGEGVGYGHDAWTDPALRGQGLRRSVFAAELRILARLGLAWEVSYFVDHQLDGGRRTLAKIGVPLTALWEIRVRPGGTLGLQALEDDDAAATPCFEYAREEKVFPC